MPSPTSQTPALSSTALRKLGVWIGCLLAVPLGLKWGYDFGNQLNGPWLGLLTATNTAALCALLVDWLVDRWPSRAR